MNAYLHIEISHGITLIGDEALLTTISGFLLVNKKCNDEVILIIFYLRLYPSETGSLMAQLENIQNSSYA